MGRVSRPLPLLILLLLLTLVVARSYPIDSDEGYTLNAAWQLWNGLRMYDDFRLFVGPGCGYAVFALWKLIGSASHLGARLLAVGFFYSSGLALYLLLRRLAVGALAAALAVVAWLFLASFYTPLNHNSFSSYAAIWFLLPFMRLVPLGGPDPTERRARWHEVLGGAGAGAVFLFLPTKGALLVAATCVWLALSLRRRAVRPLAIFLGTFAVVAILPLVLRWRPTTLVEQWLVIPLRADYLGHTGASRFYVILAAVILGAIGWAAVWTGDRRLWALGIVQAALFVSTGHNMELGHFLLNTFPTIAAVALVAQRLPGGLRRLPAFAADAALVIVAATVAGWIALTPAGRVFLSNSSLSVDLIQRPRPIWDNPRVAGARAIYAGPFLPGVYYLLGKKNPYFVSETVVCDRDCQRRLVGELEVVRPELALLNYGMIAHLGYDRSSPVDVFLRERYTRCANARFFEVLARDPGGCP